MTESTLPEHYLNAGIDALARSHPISTAESGFGDGHRASALLTAYFLMRDGLVETQAHPPIRALADHWIALPVFAPMPPEPAALGELDRLVSALGHSCGTDQCHGVIFPSLALRVFKQRPDLITRSRINGLMHIAEAYTPKQPITPPQSQLAFAAGQFADQVLTGFAESVEAFSGRFQGASFHILTFGQAVMELHAMGYVELARRAESGFRVCLANTMLGPSRAYYGRAFTVTDPAPQVIRPEKADFWLPLTWGAEFAKGLGHVLKYAYAFNTLSKHATDAQILERARNQYYRSAWG